MNKDLLKKYAAYFGYEDIPEWHLSAIEEHLELCETNSNKLIVIYLLQISIDNLHY